MVDKVTDLVIRPKKWNYILMIIVGILVVGHICIAFTLRKYNTGVNLDTIDVWSFALLGVAWAVLGWLIFSFKVTIKPVGLVVKNFWPSNTLIEWKEISDIVFPVEKRWPRLELFNQDYAPIMAIQVMDQEYAARNFSELVHIYKQNKYDG